MQLIRWLVPRSPHVTPQSKSANGSILLSPREQPGWGPLLAACPSVPPPSRRHRRRCSHRPPLSPPASPDDRSFPARPARPGPARSGPAAEGSTLGGARGSWPGHTVSRRRRRRRRRLPVAGRGSWVPVRIVTRSGGVEQECGSRRGQCDWTEMGTLASQVEKVTVSSAA